MKLNTVLKRIPRWYEDGVCVYLRSPPGRGKTTTLSRAPRILEAQLGMAPGDLGLVIINGGLLNEMDSVGYLVPKHHENFSESLFTRPFWWVTTEGKPLEAYKGGIVLLDEADKMPVECKKVWGEAALSGRLGPHTLPNGWRVWMAGNRSQDRSGSTKELDHLINRRQEIDIDDDVESLLDWMIENHVSPVTQHFTRENTQIVFPTETPKDQGPWCTPRSLVSADMYMQRLAGPKGELPMDNDTKEEVSGRIGRAASAQFFACVQLDREMPKFEKILADPKGVKVPDKADARMLISYKLAHLVTAETAEPVVIYMNRLPKEFSVTFASAACKRAPALVRAKAFDKWASENSALMAAIAR
jgi:hypothetical protein